MFSLESTWTGWRGHGCLSHSLWAGASWYHGKHFEAVEACPSEEESCKGCCITHGRQEGPGADQVTVTPRSKGVSQGPS